MSGWDQRHDIEETARDIELVRLRRAVADLAEYARHAEGCNGPHGYRCKCGYDRTIAEHADLLRH